MTITEQQKKDMAAWLEATAALPMPLSVRLELYAQQFGLTVQPVRVKHDDTP